MGRIIALKAKLFKEFRQDSENTLYLARNMLFLLPRAVFLLQEEQQSGKI